MGFRWELAQGDLTRPPGPAVGGRARAGGENCCFVVVALDMESVTFY